MAGFAINVVTSPGASLIAQATSANRIVFVDALSCPSACETASELASKDAGWYTGIHGTVEGASAEGTLAQISLRFSNTTGNQQAVKSVAVRARLASQTDADAVVLAAMCDASSDISLGGASNPSRFVRFKMDISINASNQIEAVEADGASMADLARFVSMWKAGDTEAGETQTILGRKRFKSTVWAPELTLIDESGEHSASIKAFGTEGRYDSKLEIATRIPGAFVTTMTMGASIVGDVYVYVPGEFEATGQIRAGSIASSGAISTKGGSISILNNSDESDHDHPGYITYADDGEYARMTLEVEGISLTEAIEMRRDVSSDAMLVTVYGDLAVNGTISGQVLNTSLYGDGVGALVSLFVKVAGHQGSSGTATLARGAEIQDGMAVQTTGVESTLTISSDDMSVSGRKFRLLHSCSPSYSGTTESGVYVDAIRSE